MGFREWQQNLFLQWLHLARVTWNNKQETRTDDDKYKQLQTSDNVENMTEVMVEWGQYWCRMMLKENESDVMVEWLAMIAM